MRIFVDNRFGEGPLNYFRFNLARPVELRHGSVGVIDQVLMSHTFETIMEGYNDKLYLAWQAGDYTLAPGPVFVPQGNLECRVLTITPGNYNIYSAWQHTFSKCCGPLLMTQIFCAWCTAVGIASCFRSSFRRTRSEILLFSLTIWG